MRDRSNSAGRQTDRQMDGWTDRQIKGCMVRQTDTGHVYLIDARKLRPDDR